MNFICTQLFIKKITAVTLMHKCIIYITLYQLCYNVILCNNTSSL